MSFYDAIRVGASGAADSYTIDTSLRFDLNSSAYLYRTNGSPTNQTKVTHSTWIKLAQGDTDNQVTIWGGGGGSQTNTNAEALVYITGQVIASNYKGGLGGCNVGWYMYSDGKRRDQSSWFHLLTVYDNSQSADADKLKWFMNGVQVPLISCGSMRDPYQYVNVSGQTTYIGRTDAGGGPYYSNMYLAETYFVDGTNYAYTDFTETDSTTGQIIPKDSSEVLAAITLGNNGGYYNYSDTSDIGKDHSSNSNDFTASGFTFTSGDANDQKTDTPTNNKATLNPVTGWTNNATLSDGNLKMSGSAGFKEISTIAVAGTSKLYYEVVNTSAAGWQLVGVFVGQPDNPSNALSSTPIWGFASTQATYYGGSYTSTSDVPSWSNNDVMGIKYENGNLKLYKNGTLATATTSSVPTGSIVFAYIANDNTSATAFARFNSSDWTQANAAGVDATWQLSSATLPDPTIKLPNKHFDTLLWTGTSASHTLTGLNFQPDWFWAKSRSQAYHHTLMDSVRGVDRQLWTNRTNGEQTDANFLTSFNSNGLTLGDNSSGTGATNTNGHTYVGWNWNAGDTDGKTYTVTVVDSGGNKFRFDGFAANAVTLDLAEGGTYIFNYPSGHPFRFSTTADGTHGGGSEYTTGVTHNSSTQVTIVVAASAPQLYYYCASHSGMGGAVNTNSTLGSSNFDGSIQSTVKVNATAGFSIVKYAGSGQPRTIGHGLGVAPQVVITKSRDSSDNWIVGHNSAGSTPWEGMIALNSNGGIDSGSTYFYDAAPTSTVFTRGNYSEGDDMIAYCFSEVAGYSKFGSYTGNGSSDGTFVFTGFRPALIISKKSSGTDSWQLWDNKRDPDNLMHHRLFGNENSVETTSVNSASSQLDFYSNGFKWRGSSNDTNGNGDTYIYLAFAESPFKNSRAR